MDPLGNSVYLPEEDFLPPPECRKEDLPDYLQKVIAKPAILIEIESEKKMFYFRSVDWYTTLLLTTELKQNRWEVIDCRANPNSEELSALLKKGRQRI